MNRIESSNTDARGLSYMDLPREVIRTPYWGALNFGTQDVPDLFRSLEGILTQVNASDLKLTCDSNWQIRLARELHIEWSIELVAASGGGREINIGQNSTVR